MTPLIHIASILALLPIAFFLSPVGRLVLMSIGGAAVLIAIAPTSAWVILFTCCEALFLHRILLNLPKSSLVRQYVPYVLLLNLGYTDIVVGFDLENLSTLAVGFSLIRVFMTSKQLLSLPSASFVRQVGSLAAAGFFLPAIVVGPVFSGTTLWTQALSSTESPPSTTEQNYRKMFAGWILAALVAPWFTELAGGGSLDAWTAPLVMLALFSSLFTSFWGQSLVAEGGAALAGFIVPVNFNRPWLALDIRDFWNRWHISMAKFVMQYIFLPLNLRGLPPKMATIAAFVFMGLWHEVQIGYVLWGLAHGVLMVSAPRVTADSPALHRWVSRIGTFTLVVSLSYLANYWFKV